MARSWKPEVETGDGVWTGNALRFETEQEARDYVSDLQCRWLSVRSTRVVECDLPVNYRWLDGRAVHLDDEERERIALKQQTDRLYKELTE